MVISLQDNIIKDKDHKLIKNKYNSLVDILNSGNMPKISGDIFIPHGKYDKNIMDYYNFLKEHKNEIQIKIDHTCFFQKDTLSLAQLAYVAYVENLEKRLSKYEEI